MAGIASEIVIKTVKAFDRKYRRRQKRALQPLFSVCQDLQPENSSESRPRNGGKLPEKPA
jgi:hypothetical protein